MFLISKDCTVSNGLFLALVSIAMVMVNFSLFIVLIEAKKQKKNGRKVLLNLAIGLASVNVIYVSVFLNDKYVGLLGHLAFAFSASIMAFYNVSLVIF